MNFRFSPLRAVLFSILWCTASFSAEAPVPPGLEGVPDIVAEVNGKPIHRNDLIREMVASSGTAALDRLVRRLLIEQAAKAAGVTAKVTPEIIEQQFVIDKRDLMSQLIRNTWDKNKEFPIADIIKTRFRMTVDEYKNLVIRQRLLTKFCLTQNLQPTDDQLLRYFATHNDEFQDPVMYRASHILITPISLRDFHNGLRFRTPTYQAALEREERQKRINLFRDEKVELSDYADHPPPNATREDLERWEKSHRKSVDMGDPTPDPMVMKSEREAKDILRQIRAGDMTWDQAVRTKSQDPLDRPFTDKRGKRVVERDLINAEKNMQLVPGEVGWFHAGGPLEPDFYNGAKDLKPGEIGGPVQTIYGFHLIKMLEVKYPQKVTFEQCHEKVERAFVENQVQQRAETWMKDLIENAILQSEPVLLWPPLGGRKAAEAPGTDPVVGSVNGTPIKRSEIWRELLRGESDEALDKLIHFQIVMTMLKTMGIDRMEWESSHPARRKPAPPPAKPIVVNAERVDMELNDDRIRREKEAPETEFSDYIYRRYGQSVEEYRQKIEASLVLRDAIKTKVQYEGKAPSNDVQRQQMEAKYEQTLLTEWALAKESYTEPVWYELSHILIIPTGGMDKADKAAMLSAVTIAEDVRKKYLANANSEIWNKLVQDFSMDGAQNKRRDGSLGPCYPDIRTIDSPEAPELYREIKRQKLEQGQVSPPIKSSRGYHIVRVDRVHPSMQLDFPQVRKRVERDYLQERAKMYADTWSRALTTGSKIERYLNATSAASEGQRDTVPLPLPDK